MKHLLIIVAGLAALMVALNYNRIRTHFAPLAAQATTETVPVRGSRVLPESAAHTNALGLVVTEAASPMARPPTRCRAFRPQPTGPPLPLPITPNSSKQSVAHGKLRNARLNKSDHL